MLARHFKMASSGSTIMFRGDVGLQIGGHRTNLFGHPDAGKSSPSLAISSKSSEPSRSVCSRFLFLSFWRAYRLLSDEGRPRLLDEKTGRIL